MPLHSTELQSESICRLYCNGISGKAHKLTKKTLEDVQKFYYRRAYKANWKYENAMLEYNKLSQ